MTTIDRLIKEIELIQLTTRLRIEAIEAATRESIAATVALLDRRKEVLTPHAAGSDGSGTKV